MAKADHVRWLTVRAAAQNNLKNIDVGFPLARFTCVTGVSGSGKSSLINDILQPALARALNGATVQMPGRHAGIDGLEHLDKVIAIDQSPIGRTPRSNPATYIKVFDEIRSLFTKLPDSKLRGYKPGRFSFNVATGPRGGGRCEACEGNGANRIEMDFLADVWVTCPVCSGHRFGRETLQIHYKGKSIADVLEMDVQEALNHFENQTRIKAMLQTLHDVGLDYVKLGQSSTTLSGGEAQRIKLARELVKKPTGRTLYILDEPTTGLHFEDVRRLLEVLHGFVDAGNTVVVIEHNLDVVKTADWIIDLGPEGGNAGGTVVAEGTPEDVAADERSHTGRALAEVLNGECRMANGELKTGGAISDRSSDAQGSADAGHSPFAIRHSPFADAVTVVGARQHNLKDLTVSFPRNKTTVCTGLSGSGKTSFAIDTVYTEGHRRYVESLSAYARQFLGQMAKPRVDHVHGLSPAICIEQKAASRSPRSTVGTITEIYDYMRVLWARVGTAYCHRCDIPIGTQTADEICARVMALDEGTPIIVLAPVALGDGESWASLFNRLKASGYRRVRIDGEIQETAMATTLDARRKHRVEVVVDRAIVRAKSRGRIAESVEHALALGNGVMNLLEEPFETVETDEHGGVTETKQRQPREHSFSQRFACTQCGASYSELTPHHFSFNSQLGWCETCEGLGVQRGAPESQIIANGRRSLLNGGIAGWPSIDRRSHRGRMLVALCDDIGVDVDLPLGEWSEADKRVLMFGSNRWIDFGCKGGTGQKAGAGRKAGAGHKVGVGHKGGAGFQPADVMHGLRFQWKGFFPAIDDATRNSWWLRHKLQNVVAEIPCVACRGGRLRPDAAAARLGGRTIVETCDTPLERAAEFFRTLDLDATQRRVAGELLKEIQNRLQFLIDVGLEYLALHRAAPTLSGGESQRIRLAGQIGSGLSGVLYVLDEPTIGLHPRDTGRLVRALRKLRDLGNTLLMVEHDREVIADADHILDFGPGAGGHGGRLVANASPRELASEFGGRTQQSRARKEAGLNVSGRRAVEEPDVNSRSSPLPYGRGSAEDHPGDRDSDRSLTAGYLVGEIAIPVPTNRRPVPENILAALDDAPMIEPDDSQLPQPSSNRRPATTGKRRTPRPGDRSPTGPSASSKLQSAAELAAQNGVPGATVAAPAESTWPDPDWLIIRGARQNNLKSIDAPVPLGRFTCVTGVSGSGKSSLVNDILWPALASQLQRANLTPGGHEEIQYWRHQSTKPRSHEGKEKAADAPFVPSCLRASVPLLDKVINVDQSPIGSTPSSNPATYTGAFDWIRELFTRVPDARVRGYTAKRFSFNRPGGRCEACEGEGQKRIEMHFLPDVWIECETCKGRRYNPETLDVKYKSKSIADVLEMSVADAVELFRNVPKVRRMLQTLADVGLGYVALGQSANTLSGGEAQRVKLAAELGKPNTGRTLYILDEPTTGLHFHDVRKLLDVLHRLVDLGNTVVVVEHNLDVLKNADWIIDLGPEAGDRGGGIVAMGTPERVAECRTAIAECRMEDRRTPDEQTSDESGRPQPSRARKEAGLIECDEPVVEGRPPPSRARKEAGPAAGNAPTRSNAAEANASSAIRRSPSALHSHTAAALAPILAAGPHEHRRPYDPAAHARQEIEVEKSRIDVGADTEMPWQVDGRKWHLEQRTSHHGAPVRWDPKALELCEKIILQSGDFAPTDWNDRSRVEITVRGAETWFFHALTGAEWQLDLNFRVPRGTFTARSLVRKLALKRLDDRDDLPVYSRRQRVHIRRQNGDVDSIRIQVHDRKEIDTPAFRGFVKDAARAYFDRLAPAR